MDQPAFDANQAIAPAASLVQDQYDDATTFQIDFAADKLSDSDDNDKDDGDDTQGALKQSLQSLESLRLLVADEIQSGLEEVYELEQSLFERGATLKKLFHAASE